MICHACGSPTPEIPCTKCQADPRLQGRYALLEELGSGGSGVAFRAHDTAQDQIVVIKELLVHQVGDLKALELFEREAHALRALDHPGIPGYGDSFEAGSGRQVGLYLVMEYIDGENLETMRAGYAFSEEKALRYIEPVAEVLAYLHTLSPPVLHRDIKPSNIMVTRAGDRVMLIDFGAVQESIQALGGTTVAGTYGYAPLEQWAGHAQPSSDVYALAMTLLSLLTGKPAHALLGADGTIDWPQVEAAAPNLSASLRLILEQALRPHPNERTPDGRAFLEQLKSRHLPQQPSLAQRRPPPNPEHLSDSVIYTAMANDDHPSPKEPGWLSFLKFAVFVGFMALFLGIDSNIIVLHNPSDFTVITLIATLPAALLLGSLVWQISKRRLLRRRTRDFRQHAVLAEATLRGNYGLATHLSYEDHHGTTHDAPLPLHWLPTGAASPGDHCWVYFDRRHPSRFITWLP